MSDLSENSRDELIDAGLKPAWIQSNYVLLVVMGLFGGIIPIFGPIYWFYLSIRNFIRNKTRFYEVEKEGIYVRDRRFKTGRRLEGYKTRRKLTDIYIKSTVKERIVFVVKGVLALWITIGFCFVQYQFYDAFNQASNEKSQLASAQVKAHHGLNLREESSSESKVIKSIPNDAIIKVLNMNGPAEQIGDKNANWFEIIYEQDTGWVWSGYLDIKNQ